MNLKAFTLIEVIISISLLSIVIITVLKIKENNFTNIQKFDIIKNDNQLLSIATISYANTKDVNTHLYLNEILKKSNDTLNKILKNTKVYIKSEIIDSIEIEDKIINTRETKYTIANKASTSIYTFSIDN